MGIASDNFTTITIALIALGILAWGFYRAKSFGTLGILAWLQSVVLMVPWLLFFGLFSLGIYLNLVSILFLLVGSAGLYIFLGKRLRAAGQTEMLRERAAARLQQQADREAIPEANPAAKTPSEPIDPPPSLRRMSKPSKAFLGWIRFLPPKPFPTNQGYCAKAIYGENPRRFTVA
ncbi:hypothetical protein [Neosynechococcus sphagnicola]|uniref:hypothetical protein n=1 Tax=Neosynechococcus sphagnicola TaxID=1501145 RepID=UPI000AB0662B